MYYSASFLVRHVCKLRRSDGVTYFSVAGEQQGSPICTSDALCFSNSYSASLNSLRSAGVTTYATPFDTFVQTQCFVVIPAILMINFL